MLQQADLIYVAGHRGLDGSAVVRALQRHGYRNLLLRTHRELDLTEQSAVREFLARERPAAVIMAASASWYSWDPAASTRASARSRSARNTC